MKVEILPAEWLLQTNIEAFKEWTRQLTQALFQTASIPEVFVYVLGLQNLAIWTDEATEPWWNNACINMEQWIRSDV